MRSNIFDRISFWSLFLVITLLPIFFLPFTNLPVENSKGLLLVIGLVSTITFWGFARFFDGKIIVSKSWCLLAGIGVVLATLISALFSHSSGVSFFGILLDTGTFWFIFAGFLLMLMSAIIFRNPKNSKILMFGMILSGGFVLIFQILHLFLPKILSLGVMSTNTGNLIGSWNSLGLFAGFALLMSLIIVEFFSTTTTEKIILGSQIGLSLLICAAVNFSLVWEMIGAFAVIIFIYKASIISKAKIVTSEGGISKINFPMFSIAVIIITLVFFISSSFLTGFLQNRLKINNTEIGPNLSATLSVTKSVIKTNPIVGVGPNQFGSSFAMHKPADINNTIFWDTYFSFGSGLLPTFVATTGILGILAWLAFFVLFIYTGTKSIFSKVEKDINWEKMAFFVLALYMFVACFFYATGAVIFLLGLAFAGVFIGLTSSSTPKGEVAISFLNDHRKSFFSMLFLVLIIIISIAVSFKYVERLVAFSYLEKTVTAKDISSAESYIQKALMLYQNDLFLRTYSQVYIAKLASDAKSLPNPTDADKAKLQSSLDQAVNGSQLAIAYDPKNYLNFQSLGSVYQSAASLGVKDGNAKAVEEYQLASALNPSNPGLKLAMATASFADGKNDQAKDYASQALTLKPDYIDALIVLSQISKSLGDSNSAMFYAQRALSFSPNDPSLQQYVNSLKSPAPASSTNSSDKKDTPPKN